MRILWSRGATVVAVITAFAALQTALSAELKVGDPAPQLQPAKWLQGDPVARFEPGKVYLVEFWATWCPICVETIPHLNLLYQKYKDKGLVVIGQNILEKDEALVKKFVKRMGAKMAYRVAMDDVRVKPGKMAETWVDAAGLETIPAAFLVDKQGKIAWIGNAPDLQESDIDRLLTK